MSSEQSPAPAPPPYDAILVGTGRFLRSVLLPVVLSRPSNRVLLLQPRGDTFARRLQPAHADGEVSACLEVDTVVGDGTVHTETLRFEGGAGSLGTAAGRAACHTDLLRRSASSACLVGCGVTERGVADGSAAGPMGALCEVLWCCWATGCDAASVVNTDNVPDNGTTIRGQVGELAGAVHDALAEKYGPPERRGATFEAWLGSSVTFHNSMVDRIVGRRPDDGGADVPRCEPRPAKALVVEDTAGALPAWFSDAQRDAGLGLVVRTRPGALGTDVALKLRVANGTHTAAAHALALSGSADTGALHGDPRGGTFLSYLDALVAQQIVPACVLDAIGGPEAEATYADWRGRLANPHFGLSTFFIAQNGPAKGGIRIGPTARALLAHGATITVATAFALAALLRFVTPAASGSSGDQGDVYRGWLDGHDRGGGGAPDGDGAVVYADGLRHCVPGGWYEFRCSCSIRSGGGGEENLAEALLGGGAGGASAAVRAYLTSPAGGDLATVETCGGFDGLVAAVAAMYLRMVEEGVPSAEILEDMSKRKGDFSCLGFGTPCSTFLE